eukprot:366958_1
MYTFESLCRLIFEFQQCNKIDFKSNEYKEITNKIKQIIQISQTQFLQISRVDALLDLLKADWKFFMSFMHNEIQTEFTKPHNKDIFELMSVACSWWNELESLCQIPWVRQSFVSASGRLPKEWDEFICINVLKNFSNDFQSFTQLVSVLEQFETSNMNCKYFGNITNGICCLFEIMLTALLNTQQPDRVLRQRMIGVCQVILKRLFILLPYSHIRKEMLKLFDDRNSQYSIYLMIYWIILEHVMIDNTSDHKQLKKVLQEMVWYVQEYPSRHITNDGKQTLIQLQTQNFTDSEIVTYLDDLACLTTH